MFFEQFICVKEEYVWEKRFSAMSGKTVEDEHFFKSHDFVVNDQTYNFQTFLTYLLSVARNSREPSNVIR